MRLKTQNWETFFYERDILYLFAEIKDAERAFNMTVNHNGKIIHPGAFLVFREHLKNILNETEWFAEMCEKADIQSFTPEVNQEAESEETK